jgi:cytochrome c peroxidase
MTGECAPRSATQGRAGFRKRIADFEALNLGAEITAILAAQRMLEDRAPYAFPVRRWRSGGQAALTGNCADIGKVKGPFLRGLAARAPYFHNGSAATLLDVVNFYDQRFGIGFTRQQKDDLVNFLSTL